MHCPKGENISSFRPEQRGQLLRAELPGWHPSRNRGSSMDNKVHFGFCFKVGLRGQSSLASYKWKMSEMAIHQATNTSLELGNVPCSISVNSYKTLRGYLGGFYGVGGGETKAQRLKVLPETG